MCQLKKLAVQALGVLDLAASFFAYVMTTDTQDWEEVDDLLAGPSFSENEATPVYWPGST